jgi:hypothetical protein
MVDDTARKAEWDPPPASTRSGPSPTAIYRRLTIQGWSSRDAGNLVAALQGLRPARQGWTVNEIDHLMFLRALLDSGRLD